MMFRRSIIKRMARASYSRLTLRSIPEAVEAEPAEAVERAAVTVEAAAPAAVRGEPEAQVVKAEAQAPAARRAAAAKPEAAGRPAVLRRRELRAALVPRRRPTIPTTHTTI